MGKVQVAILAGALYTLLRDAVFTHPTMSESLGMLFARVPKRLHWRSRVSFFVRGRQFLFVRIDHEHGQQLGGFDLARMLIKSVPITGHLGKVLSGAISNDWPIIGFVHNFASSCFGFYLVGTSTGAPLSFTKNTTNFAGLVWLAFRPTT